MRIKNRDGNMLVEGKAVRQRWTEYCDELVSIEDDVKASIWR